MIVCSCRHDHHSPHCSCCLSNLFSLISAPVNQIFIDTEHCLFRISFLLQRSHCDEVVEEQFRSAGSEVDIIVSNIILSLCAPVRLKGSGLQFYETIDSSLSQLSFQAFTFHQQQDCLLCFHSSVRNSSSSCSSLELALNCPCHESSVVFS